jgi:tetratricopeptide (TPR) repeat protein
LFQEGTPDELDWVNNVTSDLPILVISHRYHHRREFRITQELLGDSEFCTIASNEGWLLERKEWITNVLLMESKVPRSKEDAVHYFAQLLQSIEYEQLGDCHGKANEWELAITQYNCALALESAAHARNRIDMADLHTKIGDCWVKIQDYDGALLEFQNAQSIYKEQFGNSHTAVAIVHSKLASVHLKLRDYDSALAFHSKSYAIYEEFFGREHDICIDGLKDIRLVAVKEIEDLRLHEYRKLRQEKKQAKVYDFPSARQKGLRSSPRHTF